MSNINKYIVITSINKKTDAIKAFEKFKEWNLVIIGDKKSYNLIEKNNLKYLSVGKQKKIESKFSSICPYNSYVRKNIGYLYCFSKGADFIYETDDDNIPYKNWYLPDFKSNKEITTNSKFINILRYFTEKKIWPRGLPLEEILKFKDIKTKNIKNKKIGVWQSLADLDPDVDAIYRLIINKKIKFKKKQPVSIKKNLYTPFNSQSTFWNKEIFRLMYLPVTVRFRVCDILRSYIAQRIMWEHNFYLGYLSSNVFQIRNEHDLLKDFNDELDCYIYLTNIVNLLDKLNLKNLDITNQIISCYEVLVKNNYLSKKELYYLNAWIKDCNSFYVK